jgi:hypothetical protein
MGSSFCTTTSVGVWESWIKGSWALELCLRLSGGDEITEWYSKNRSRWNQPIHYPFHVGCLKPCLQRTSVHVGSPQLWKHRLPTIAQLRGCYISKSINPWIDTINHKINFTNFNWAESTTNLRESRTESSWALELCCRLSACDEITEWYSENIFRQNQPMHYSSLVECLNPCLQRTNVQFGSPQSWKHRMPTIAELRGCYISTLINSALESTP